jgi:hypothetical protein
MKYTYNGPNSGITLSDGKEILLFSGAEIELPEDNEYTKTLLALGYLQEIKKNSKMKEAENAG